MPVTVDFKPLDELRLVRKRARDVGAVGSVMNACLAVAAGLANHVLCFRSVWEGSAQGDKGRSGVMPGGGGGGGGSFKASGFHAVEPPVHRTVGRDLDRDVRPAPLP